MQLRVKNIQFEAEGVVSVLLESPDGEALPPWTPGAHIDVHLPNGIVRQYSLCGDLNLKTAYKIAVREQSDGRGGSRFIHNGLRVGELIQIGGPRNNFELEPAEGYTFIAGGIGITPIIPMLVSAKEAGVPWRLIYCGKSKSRMAFLEQLDAYGPQVEIACSQEAGRISLSELVTKRASGLVYCCGPESLLAGLEDVCEAEGVLSELRVERFSIAETDVNAEDDRPVSVIISSTGEEVFVPAGQSILNALLDEGIDVPFSCEEGMCGTCEVPVKEGSVDHRDGVLSKSEKQKNDRILICVSRANSERLVLDI